MTFIVTDNCLGCRFTDCVTVCPVDCFHGDEQMLYIDPGVCIDCGACEPQCPVHAIFEEGSIPSDQKHWTAKNAELAPGLPNITAKQPALAGADEKKKKLGY